MSFMCVHSDPKYNSIRQMAISEAEMVGEKYQISPVDLVGYLDTKTDMISEKTTDDGKKEVLIANNSFDTLFSSEIVNFNATLEQFIITKKS